MTGSDEDITSVNNSKMIDRPVTGSLPACAGTDTDSPSGIYEINDKQPVTELVTARASDTEEPLVMTMSTVTMAISELRTSVCVTIPILVTYLSITNIAFRIDGGQ